MTRQQLYGLVHKGAQAFLQLNKMDKVEADTVYRQWLNKKLSVTSCKDATTAQLDALVRELKQRGALTSFAKPYQKAQGGKTGTRPTDAQYKKLHALLHAKGWCDIEDPQLVSFVKRTAKVDAVRFLTRRQMSAVITGLENWLNG